MLKRFLCRCLLTLTSLVFVDGVALAWGERGHDLVTRVAARILAARAGKDTRLAPLLLAKEHMLGHFANVPDIVWRNDAKDVQGLNAPTHYIDLEYLGTPLTLNALPRTPAELAKRMTALCAQPPSGYVCPEHAKDGKPTAAMAGTAPFRAEQMTRLMQQSLAARKFADALLAAGLLSHFVGDLGQPYHTTRDYDGWETQHGGVHSYYETDVVNAFPLSLDQDVYDAALAGKNLARLAKTLSGSDLQDPLTVAYALALDSQARLAALDEIDRTRAVLKPSRTDHGMRLKAERRPAAETAASFHDVTVERLATAAEVLAHLWQTAWQKAGSPDLSGYHSFDYPVAPAFIRPEER